MLNLEQIQEFYPEHLRQFRNFLLREYLQHKILNIVYNSESGRKIVFMGGTALRLTLNNQRFSEDLDFDNLGLSIANFQLLSDTIKKELELEGYQVETKVVHRTAFHCYIRFPGILFEEGLSGHREQKILIQLDAENQAYSYQPELYLLNNFDIFTEILVCPKPLLLAQKFYAIVNRKRRKGRDFYDALQLINRGVRPDYDYLSEKTGISNPAELKAELHARIAPEELNELADDVRPFLIQPGEQQKVRYFHAIMEQDFFRR